MPFDGNNIENGGDGLGEKSAFRPATRTSQPGRTSLFGMDTGDWHGFFFGLTGVFALVLGLSAVLMELLGR